jgi:hypothetical protein
VNFKIVAYGPGPENQFYADSYDGWRIKLGPVQAATISRLNLSGHFIRFRGIPTSALESHRYPIWIADDKGIKLDRQLQPPFSPSKGEQFWIEIQTYEDEPEVT